MGRADLLAAVEGQLTAGGSVVLTGSSGIGKTAIVDAVGSAAALRGERVLRVAGAETERWISFAGLADLLSQMPEEFVTDLPEPQHARAGRGGHRRGVDLLGEGFLHAFDDAGDADADDGQPCGDDEHSPAGLRDAAGPR